MIMNNDDINNINNDNDMNINEVMIMIKMM